MNNHRISNYKFLSAGSVMLFAFFTLVSNPGNASTETIKVVLEGAQEVPATKTAGAGSGNIVVNTDKTVSGSITTSALTSTMAHIHVGAKGVSGPVAITLTKKGETYTVPADAKLSDTQYESFKKGELYINVHTAANPNGEIRGQLKP